MTAPVEAWGIIFNKNQGCHGNQDYNRNQDGKSGMKFDISHDP
jgi:hypothetical protein